MRCQGTVITDVVTDVVDGAGVGGDTDSDGVAPCSPPPPPHLRGHPA